MEFKFNNRVTAENIERLEANQIFVYGANEAWRHGKGAAKFSLNFGARYGEGPYCGDTYGICTKNKNIQTLPLESIKIYIDTFIEFTKQRPHLTFLVTPIGTNLAGYSPEQIAPLFVEAISVENIHLPKSFWNVLLSKSLF